MDKTRQAWIGVDLDGTLAHYDHWRGPMHIGEPIALMMERVKGWIEDGKEVRILTARVGYSSVRDDPVVLNGRKPHQLHLMDIQECVQDWCEEHGLPRLLVTAQKDYLMTEFWDDRCKQVIPNEGVPIEEALAQSKLLEGH